MTNGLENWVERISAEELPALCTTVRQLERLAADETTSLAKIGQIILPDHGLTSRVLQVVNAACYRRGRNQITTVSRAAIILGYDAIKHICITARMIDSMLKNRSISKPLYQRVVHLFAQSFQAGMLARMLLEKHDGDTREEAYIAALLHNLGEIAFWSLGGKQAETLDEAIRTHPQHQEQLIQKSLGTNFNKLSSSLARNWNMGEVLIQSLENPQERTPELKAILLANQFAANMMSPQSEPREQAKLFKDLAEATGIPEAQLEQKIQKCRKETEELALSYGSMEISRQLKRSGKLVFEEELLRDEQEESREALQLKLLRELSNLALENSDVNTVIHTAMEGIYRGIGLNRVAVLMANQHKDQLRPRFISSRSAEQDQQGFMLQKSSETRPFFQPFATQQPIWIKFHDDTSWGGSLSRQMLNLISESGCFIAPIICEQHCIGVFYADSDKPLSHENFAGFNHFVQQNNLCLNAILMRSRQAN